MFNINCAACHSKLGDGNGTPNRIGAMAVVANLHDKRIVELTDGELFNTVSYGKGLMQGYAATCRFGTAGPPSRIARAPVEPAGLAGRGAGSSAGLEEIDYERTFPSGGLPPLDFSRWRKVPNLLIGGGFVLCLLGAVWKPTQFAYSWLLAFMFCLSFVLGALFLVLMHHLFDAGWSVGIRRFCEHLACLAFPWMALFFVPIALLAPKIYTWMSADPRLDNALAAKWPLFTKSGFYLAAVLCFGVWALLTSRLRYWSLRQDADGSARCTYRMRFHSSWGILALRSHADAGGDHVDEGAAIPMVLHHVWRVLLSPGRLGRPGRRLT